VTSPRHVRPLLAAAVAAASALHAVPLRAPAFPVHGQRCVLPVGSDLNVNALLQPA
jgi:hypothetical protein